MTVRPRRSVLYMPGSNARALEKARELPADGLILDLEDAVAPEAKAQAREAIVKALKTAASATAKCWCASTGSTPAGGSTTSTPSASAQARCGSGAESFDPGQLQDLAARMVDMGTDPHVRVWAMMETPLAMLNVRDIAASALDSETRLAGFVMGTNDLAKDTRARLVPGRAPMLPWLMTCVAAARAYGLDILDGVYNDLGNAEGFAEECKQARDLGFDGKTLIHPRQIEPCNEAFSPTPEEVAMARKMIAAFELPENENKGVVQIDGRMVERLHAEMARRTVAIADAIAKRRQPA